MRARPVMVAMAMLLGAAACGDGGGTETSQAPTTVPPGATPSRPFTVGAAPEGYVARSAGEGRAEQAWSDDSFGDDEPYLVLSPDGSADHPDIVLVSLTGYQGFQGGLDQASAAYGGADTVDVGGQDARFAPARATDDPDAGGGPHWADLVVAQGDRDLAIRATSPDATFEELAAVIERVEVPDDHARPPSVPDPPDGLEVVGGVDARAVIATFPYVDQQSDGGPGPVGAHSVGWLDGGTEQGDQLVAMTLPAGSADLDALTVGYRWQWVRRTSGMVTAEWTDDHVVLERVEPDGVDQTYTTRSVWLTRTDGDLVVAATAGLDPVDEATLLALARSVAPTDEATWDAFVSDVRGGPGLHADPGRAELMRGTAADGREWLLQDQPPGEGNMGVSTEGPLWSVDPCLEVSDGTRSCPQSEGDGPGGWTASGGLEPGALPYVVVATTNAEVAGARVTTDGVVETRPLVPVPGTDQRAVAVVGEAYQVQTCTPQESFRDGPRTVVLVDGDGQVVPCPAPG